MPIGYTYIMGSPAGTLYVGITSDLYHRALEHKSGTYEGFSARYHCTRLLYYETFDDIRVAINREKQLKRWRREKKLTLIRTTNPEFKDLAQTWGQKMLFTGERINPEDQPSS